MTADTHTIQSSIELRTLFDRHKPNLTNLIIQELSK